MSDQTSAETTQNDAPNTEQEESEEQIVAAGIEALDNFISNHPRAVGELSDIIAHYLEDAINEQTWAKLAAALTRYLGDSDAVAILNWALVADAGDGSRLERVEESASPATVEVVRRLTAIYGLEVRDAYALFDQLPNNWRSLNRDIYYDMVTGRHLMRISIEKYDGETSVIEGPPDSILGLVRFLMIALKVVASSPDAFSSDELTSFMTDTSELIEILQSRMTQTPDAITEAGATPVAS